jgi:hypothetical protein
MKNSNSKEINDSKEFLNDKRLEIQKDFVRNPFNL